MRYDQQLFELARRQHNLVGRAQTVDLGLKTIEWSRLGSGSNWTAVTPRVLRVAGAGPSRGEALLTAILDDGLTTFASFDCAAWWWGLPGFSPARVSLVRTATSTRQTTLAEVHRIRRLEPEWTTVLDGVPVVRPEMLILHLCAGKHPGRAERALDNAWNLRLLSGRSLIRFLAQYGERGRNGTALLREFVDARGPDYVPPASNLEARANKLFIEAGVEMERQVDSGGDNWTGRVDFREKCLPLIAEIQSERYHTALLDKAADTARLEQLRADGFTVLEFTDVEIWSQPATVVERMRSAVTRLRREIS